MRTGTSINNFAHRGDKDAQYARMRELGYDAVHELLDDTRKLWFSDVAEMEKHCNMVRQAAANQGIEIHQVHGPWPTDDTSEEKREKVKDYMHRAVYGCHLMGSRYLVVHPQMPYGWRNEEDPAFSRAKTKELLLDLIPDCEKYGVTVCLENMPMIDHKISPMSQIVDLVAEIDHPLVGICMDTGHCNVFGDDLGEMVKICAPYLKVLHVHDNDGRRDWHWLPYTGTANWEGFIEALAEVDFQGVISFETEERGYRKLPGGLNIKMEEIIAALARSIADAVDAKRR